MPDTPSSKDSSSHDDPFADLFAKLPDPKARDAIVEGTAPVPASAPPQAPAGPVAAAAADPAAPAPLSRRAAREAALGTGSAATTGEAPPAAPAVPPAAAVSAPVTPAPVTAAAPPAGTAAPTAVTEEPVLVGATVGATSSSAHEPRRSTASAATGTAVLGLDELFVADTGGAGGKPPKKKRRRIGGWIALGVVLALIGGVVVGGVWAWNTYEDKIREVMGWEEPKDYEAGMATGEAVVTIESGDTGLIISQSLFDAGVTKTPEAFYDYLVDTEQNPPFIPGAFQLQKQMTSAAALEALMDPANKLENSALIREGLTVAQTIPILSESLGIPAEEFQSAVSNPSAYGVDADSLEGWLFPAMYTFDPGATPTQIIQTMVDRTVQSLDAAEVPVEQREEILTIASIIQREARFEDDFYKVSRVIQNRMDPDNQETFGLLQMDSTAQYGFGEDDGTASTSEDAQFDDNPWNTYVHPGLPIGPISNPGDVAIDAAMHPVDGPWIYFVTVNLDTGETVFSTTLGEHERARQQMITWCADHPDSGC